MALFLHRRKVAERELAKKEQPKVEPKKEEKKEESGITKEDVAALPFFKLKYLETVKNQNLRRLLYVFE